MAMPSRGTMVCVRKLGGTVQFSSRKGLRHFHSEVTLLSLKWLSGKLVAMNGLKSWVMCLCQSAPETRRWCVSEQRVARYWLGHVFWRCCGRIWWWWLFSVPVNTHFTCLHLYLHAASLIKPWSCSCRCLAVSVDKNDTYLLTAGWHVVERIARLILCCMFFDIIIDCCMLNWQAAKYVVESRPCFHCKQESLPVSPMMMVSISQSISQSISHAVY